MTQNSVDPPITGKRRAASVDSSSDDSKVTVAEFCQLQRIAGDKLGANKDSQT